MAPIKNLERRNTMKQDNRVLARIQARELSEKEQETVTGGVHTNTVCTFSGTTGADGDRGECGGL